MTSALIFRLVKIGIYMYIHFPVIFVPSHEFDDAKIGQIRPGPLCFNFSNLEDELAKRASGFEVLFLPPVFSNSIFIYFILLTQMVVMCQTKSDHDI